MAKISDGKILCGSGGNPPVVADVRVGHNEKFDKSEVILYLEVAGVLNGKTVDEGWSELDDGPETVEVSLRVENDNHQYAAAARKSLETLTGVPMPDEDDWHKVVFEDHPGFVNVADKPAARHVQVREKTNDKGFVNRYYNPVLATRPDKMSFAAFKAKYRRAGEPAAAY